MKKSTLLLLSVLAICACGRTAGKHVDFPTDCDTVYFTKHGDPIELAYINHGSIAIRYQDLVFQIDPVMQMGDKKIDYSEFGKADAIFITHEHFDHLSLEAIDSLSDDHTRIFANEASQKLIGRGTVMHNEDWEKINDRVFVKAMAAYNTTPGHEQFHPRGNGNCYVFLIDNANIYVSGDTEPIPEMSELGEVDVAFIAVNQPYTMTPEQCIEATKTIRPKILIPYHMGDTDVEQIVEGLKDFPVEIRIHEELR